MNFTQSQFTRAARLSLAMIISFVYVAYIGMSDGIWVIMTCAIILFDNPTLGGTINKSHLRFWGTFFAAAFSLIFIVGFANNVIINLLGVVIGTFLAAYWYMDTAQGYIGGLISWTLPIILLNNNDIKSAFLRLMNIIIGIIVSYIMLRYFYPEYARDNMLKSMHKTLVELKILLLSISDPELGSEQIQVLYLNHEAKILTEINSFNRWQTEAKWETKRAQEYVDAAALAYLHIRRLYRLLSVVIFYFNCDEIRHNSKIQPRFTQIKCQLEGMIDALIQNQKQYYLPEIFNQNNKNITSELLNHDEYQHYQNLSIQTITDIIQIEINVITTNLIKLFKSRQTHNYY
ncbi:MAG TPA: FUSC family protein [Burkholderiales bacterium]|nr:FUSC family protein [Burkholderiales bacterium]